MDHIPFPKQPRKLAVILSREEVGAFLEGIANYRHRIVFNTIYATGMRLSEVTHLKPEHIDSKRMVIRIEQGKGMKDRYVMLSPNLLEMLREYYKVARPGGKWLFSSPHDPTRPLSMESLQKCCRPLE